MLQKLDETLISACFTVLVENSLWVISVEVRGQCTVHLISGQTRHEAIKCTKGKE